MLLLSVAAAHAFTPFEIELVDRATGAPAPCVELVSTGEARWVSDVHGRVAVVEPDLVGVRVWFHVEGPGYGHPPDGFGFRGFAVDVTEGGAARVELDRIGPPAPCVRDHHSRLLDHFPEPSEMHRVEVVDEATGRGVPLVALQSDLGALITDNGGNIAVYDPDLLGSVVTFAVASHGYAHPAGEVTIDLAPGGHTVVEVERRQIAERLYRVTGQGLRRDTVLLGLPAPPPVLAGEVVGQDSALAIPWNGRILWVFGDTERAAYPLGLFQAAGAWADLPAAGGLPPSEGVALEYLVGDDGFARAMAPNQATVPTWLSALAVVDDGGDDVLVGLYGLFEGLAAVELGVVRFDDASETFLRAAELPVSAPFREANHLAAVEVDGRYLYDRNGYRVPATIEAFSDPAAWEGWTPAQEAWVPGAAAPTDGWSAPREPDTGEEVVVHNGAVAFNAHRRRWLHVFTQNGGTTSWLGEIWLSEADTPFGPWLYARRILTHAGYTFYNPLLLPFLDEDGGRTVYLQGTYSEFFSGVPVPTPRYDYNQLQYRLDLDDPGLILPVAVYDAGDGTDPRTAPALRADDPAPRVAFHAPDRPGDGLLAVWWEGPSCAGRTLEVGVEPPGEALFWVLPVDAEAAGTVPLRRAAHADGRQALVVGEPAAGFVVEPEPVGRVWPHPIDAAPPVLDHLPPRVDAGPDRCVAEETAGAGAVVAFEAAARGLDGGRWAWAVDGDEVAEGQDVALTLSVGAHRVTVTWTDGAHVYHDEAQVLVSSGPEAGGPGPDGAPADGCGCRTSAGGPWWLALALAAVGRRRGALELTARRRPARAGRWRRGA